ncbi:hypothetical protein C0J52_10194 [Blattella germanica]|nr:hypothetical protein C0J52_10194 [Blattella germanica]
MAISRIILVALAIFCYIQVDAAIVKRDTSSTTDLSSALNNLGNVISQGWANFTEAWAPSLPSQEQATSHQGELHNVLQQVATKWNETATSLQNTDVNKTAQELQQQAQTSFNSFLEEARKLVTAVGSTEGTENVRNVASQAISKAEEIANEFRTSLQSTTSH